MGTHPGLVSTPTPPRAACAALSPSGPARACQVTVEQRGRQHSQPRPDPGTGVPTRDPGRPAGGESPGDRWSGAPQDGWGRALPQGRSGRGRPRRVCLGRSEPCHTFWVGGPAEDGTWEAEGLLGGTSGQDEWALLTFSPRSVASGAETLPSRPRRCCPALLCLSLTCVTWCPHHLAPR